MDDKLWAKHCYVMDAADRDETFCKARERYNDWKLQFSRYLDSQTEEVREMLMCYMWNFKRMNIRLFNLACEYLIMPDDPGDSYTSVRTGSE